MSFPTFSFNNFSLTFLSTPLPPPRTHFTTLFFRAEMFVAIKVVKSAEQYKEAAEDEIKILKHVCSARIFK